MPSQKCKKMYNKIYWMKTIFAEKKKKKKKSKFKFLILKRNEKIQKSKLMKILQIKLHQRKVSSCIIP